MTITTRRTFLPPHLMLLLAPIIWSTSNVTGKLSIGIMTPYQFTFYRWIFAALLLTLCCQKYIRQDWAQIKARWLWLFFWGGMAFSFFNIVLYQAIEMKASLVNIAIIFALIPVIVLVINKWIFHDPIHPLQWLGTFVTIAAVIWLVTRGQPLSLTGWQPNRAEALVLIPVLIYAGYSVVLRNAPNIHWTSLMWSMCCAAAIISLPFYLYELSHTQQLLAPTQPNHEQILKAIALVTYVTLFVAILSKMFYMEGVIALGASRGALVMNLLPIFNTIAALLIFSDERAGITHITIVSLILVISGIALSEYGAMRNKLTQ